MKRSVLALLFINICCVLSVSADENIRTAQTRLRQKGFYFGDADGVYSSETAAAVTRFQIRNGLQITGKLDGPTAQSLGTRPMTSAADEPPTPLAGTWRQLRNGHQQFVPVKTGTASATSSPVPTASRPVRQENIGEKAFGRERLRDYVGAFVLAGLDPKIGAELEFFANRVDYFGDGNVSRDKIQRDLAGYDARWPQRRFWLVGELEMRSEPDGRLRVTFPLRYELHRRSASASGTVRKTLVLKKTADDDLEIVAVNEKKID